MRNGKLFHMLSRLLLMLLAMLASAAHAAASGQPLTPTNVSVAGGDSRVFSVRFFDSLGQPAAGESVQFVNDACGVFPNGASVITVQADATGVASTRFTARNQGITCWLVASAGAQVRFDVLTFTLGQVYFSTALTPSQPRVGAPFSVSVSPMAGAYRLYHADVTARVIAGTASAAISPGVANSGDTGTLTFNVFPDGRVGDYDIELDYRGVTQRVSMRASATTLQDMWWGGIAENGWGMSVVQHRDMLFSVIYAYDAAGKPTWYVMPGGTWNEAHTVFSGALYAPRGSPYSAYEPASFVVGAPVGNASFTVEDGANLMLEYTINGVSGRRNVTRQPFGPIAQALAASLGDMWWGGSAQNGWGIAVLQQYRTLFAVWFTYDATGAPTWFVMPGGAWMDADTYEGRIYRASGAPWLGAVYDVRAFRVTEVGTFRLSFSGDTASFEYSIDGRVGTLPLVRQPF